MSSQQEYANYLQNLSNLVNFWFSAIMVPIGVVLNILTILIFSSAKQGNDSILYIALSVYDILCLFTSTFTQLLPALNINISNYSDIPLCRLFNILRKAIAQSPSWVQVVITIDRFRSVVCPSKLDFFRNKRNLTLILISIIFILIAVNSGYLWFYLTEEVAMPPSFDKNPNKIKNTTARKNTSVCFSSVQAQTATDIINVLFRLCLPVVIMFVMNIILTRSLILSKRKFLTPNGSLKREFNYTLTVIGLNLIFCVLNMPWAIWYALNRIQIARVGFQSPIDFASLQLLQSFSFSIFYLNNSSSFLLNLTFNKLFRKQLYLLLTKLSLNRNDQSTENGLIKNNLELKKRVNNNV